MGHDMSGIETLLASLYTGLTTAGTAAGTAAAGTAAAGTTAAATTAAATGAAATGAAATGAAAGLASAGEIALIDAAAKAAAGTGAASAGLTTAELIAAGSSLAGAGSQLLSGEAPRIDLPKAPTRDDARTAADRQNFMLKRRGRAATLLTSPQGVASSPTLGSPSLTGSG